MTDVVIVAAARSAVARGKADGALASLHPVDLSAAVMREVVGRSRLAPSRIDDVIWGCAMPEGSQSLRSLAERRMRAQSHPQITEAMMRFYQQQHEFFCNQYLYCMHWLRK